MTPGECRAMVEGATLGLIAGSVLFALNLIWARIEAEPKYQPPPKRNDQNHGPQT